MPLYKFEGTSGWAGCDETFVVDAVDEWIAVKVAEDYWNDTAQIEVSCLEEITEEQAEQEGLDII